MELRRQLRVRNVLTFCYILALVIYLVVGLQPAGATASEIASGLVVPSIHLATGVTKVSLVEHKLATPDTLVGSYQPSENKTFLIGHSTTAFRELQEINIGDSVFYDGLKYRVVRTQLQVKSDVNMGQILADTDVKTVVMMTCAGELTGGGDATHRFIVTAVLN